MKAQVINVFGNPSVFMMMDLPIPEVKPGHNLEEVAKAHELLKSGKASGKIVISICN